MHYHNLKSKFLLNPTEGPDFLQREKNRDVRRITAVDGEDLIAVCCLICHVT